MVSVKTTNLIANLRDCSAFILLRHKVHPHSREQKALAQAPLARVRVLVWADTSLDAV